MGGNHGGRSVSTTHPRRRSRCYDPPNRSFTRQREGIGAGGPKYAMFSFPIKDRVAVPAGEWVSDEADVFVSSGSLLSRW